MRSFLSILILSVAFCSVAIGQSFTEQADAFFRAHVKNGMVDYAAIKANPANLNALAMAINKSEPHEGNAEKAFLINAYNILVIQSVVEDYPIEGPLKVAGFFDKNMHGVRGQKTTLNQLEKEILYKKFPDARLHFALVCAAKGCPKLASFAYTSALLEKQLEGQTRAAINDASFVRLGKGSMQISQLFEWYAKDFGGEEKTANFISKYLAESKSVPAKFTFYTYDWTLNGK